MASRLKTKKSKGIEMSLFDCNLVMEKIYEYLDQELAETDKEQIDQHLADCNSCRAEFVLEQQITQKIISSSWNQISIDELVQRSFMQLSAEEEN
jgi:mycothiol system anti-sigma-R factor